MGGSLDALDNGLSWLSEFADGGCRWDWRCKSGRVMASRRSIVKGANLLVAPPRRSRHNAERHAHRAARSLRKAVRATNSTQK
jgi:hypothetical protein